MGLTSTIQQLVDSLFANLQQQYARRPLILIVIKHMQDQIDAALPGLLAQAVPDIVTQLTAVVDGAFAQLEADVGGVPLLGDALKEVNKWIDTEIASWAQQLAS